MMTTPGRGRRSISENVWLLQNALAKVLNDGDRTFLIHSLNQYQRDRDILQLVASLKRVLDTPNKREVYPLLREIIPSSDKRYFERAWHTNQPQHLHPSGNNSNSTRSRSRSPNQSQERLRRSQLYSSLPENLDRCDSGVDLPALKKSSSSRSFQKYPIRRLYLKRVPGTGYGFCMRGGSEHGVGLYVSSVDENSIAEYEGLLPGDHILSVNDIQFNGLSHDQAVKIIKKTKKLNMVVRSVGRIPNTFVAESTYKWIDPTGQRVSPPPNVDSNGREMSIDGIHRSDLRLLGDDDERKVNVFIEDGDKLGLKIRGGSEYGLGIYIAGVDPHSAAEKAGLKCGDQIMDVNGISFLNITHADAVKVLKSAKNMMVTMKDVGRLPFAKTVMDKTCWAKGKLPYKPVQSDAESVFTTTVQIHEPPDYRRHTTANSRFETERSENSKFRHGIAGSQLLYNGTGPSTKSLAEEQARQVLNENDLGTMSYYMDEYCKGFITVDAFVLALFSLLNTPAKVSLLSEVRGFIHPRDIDRFDDLVLKKEIEAIKKRNVPSRVTQDDAHSIRSYSSSVSSFSEHGSTSSKSSAKESLDSRPITPPRVPEILPENMKVARVGNDLGKSGSEELLDDTGNEGIPSFMPNDDTLNDSRDSIPSPPTDFNTVFPLSSSSPRKPKHDAVTNGEITKYLITGDNTRVKDVPHKKHGYKKSHKHTEKKEKEAEKKPEDPTSEKEHSKPKNDCQSSSNHSFELIPESKKEKRGFFLHLNKGSYSPYKHDHSLVPKESSNLYNVTQVKKKDEEYADSPSKRSIGEFREKLENHVETSSKLLKTSENLDSTLVVDSEWNASVSKLMNGYYTSTKKHPHESSLANIPNSPAPNAADKQPSTSKALFRPKQHHAKTEVQNKEESNLEDKKFKSSAQLNSAFAPPKPKPHVSQAQDPVIKDKNDGDHGKEDTCHEVETSYAPQNPKPYVSLQKSEASKEELPNQDSVEHQENEYVDIDSIRRSKERYLQSKQGSDKNINGDKPELEYVYPGIIDLGINPPPKPTPYLSKAENDMAEKNGFSTLYDEHPEDNNKANFESRRLVNSPVSNLSPKLKSRTPKTENSIPEKGGSNRHYNGHPEIGETYLEGKTNSSSPNSAPYSSIAVDTNSNLSDSSKLRNGRKSGSVVPPNAKVYDLKSSAHTNGMFLAMEEITNTRSGLEKSTSWGEESLPTVSASYDSFYKTTMVRETTAKSLQDRNSIKKRNYEMIDNDVAVSNHADKEVLVEDRESVTRSDQENVTRTESTTWSHASPKQEKDGATDSHSDSKQEDVTKSERFTKSHALDQKDMALQYDVDQNLEEIPQKQSVFNMIKAYNRMSDATNTRGDLSRKGSNRKSWDGVGNPSKTGQDQEISMVDKKNSLKSNSDSNLMNLPKYQKKSIQVKLRASQELLELRQQSRDSSTNNSRRSSIEVSFPSEQRLSTGSSSTTKSQPHPGDGYDVELEKTSNGLGLTLEGGSDTSSRNAPVKIKLVKEGPYAAHMSGKLHPGQIILQINGKSIQGMTNGMAVLTLRQAYSDPESKKLLLVVKDP